MHLPQCRKCCAGAGCTLHAAPCLVLQRRARRAWATVPRPARRRASQNPRRHRAQSACRAHAHVRFAMSAGVSLAPARAATRLRDVRLDLHVLQPLLQERHERARWNITLCHTGFRHQRFMCKHKSSVRESCERCGGACMRGAARRAKHARHPAPDSCRYRYTRKLTSSDDSAMPMRGCSCSIQHCRAPPSARAHVWPK